MGTDCWNKILNFHLSISLMRHNSHRSIQPSPSEQIAFPIRGRNQPYTLPLWGLQGRFWVAKGGRTGRQKGEKLLQGFLCINLLCCCFFFSQGWLLTRLNSIYCMQLLKEVSWSTDNP